MTRRTWLGLLVAALAAASSSCGYALAGRGSFLPAYIKIIGIPQFVNTTPVYELEQVFTEKVRTEFINRGNYKVEPATTRRRRAADWRDSQYLDPAGQLHRPAAGEPLRPHGRGEDRVPRPEDQQRAVGEPQWVYREEYEATAGTDALDPNAFLAQGSDALERVGTEFAKAVVSAILEAF